MQENTGAQLQPLTFIDTSRLPLAAGKLLSSSVLLQDREPVSREYWRLVYGGKQLADDKTLHQCGIKKDATLHLVGHLLGGKGGFGSLLRGAGRAILTDNVDACRDLSGRRLRQANAEKRLTEWAAEARERELEKVALKHVKEQQKATQKEQRAQVKRDCLLACRTAHRHDEWHIYTA